MVLLSRPTSTEDSVIFSVSRGSVVLLTRMAASAAHDLTSYWSSVIVCKAELNCQSKIT